MHGWRVVALNGTARTARKNDLSLIANLPQPSPFSKTLLYSLLPTNSVNDESRSNFLTCLTMLYAMRMPHTMLIWRRFRRLAYQRPIRLQMGFRVVSLCKCTITAGRTNHQPHYLQCTVCTLETVFVIDSFVVCSQAKLFAALTGLQGCTTLL